MSDGILSVAERDIVYDKSHVKIFQWVNDFEGHRKSSEMVGFSVFARYQEAKQNKEAGVLWGWLGVIWFDRAYTSSD